MVSLENTYHLRQFLFEQAIQSAENNPFNIAFLKFLNLLDNSYDYSSVTPIYLKCAISGISKHQCLLNDLKRLLGQKSFIDGTPMPWVSNIWLIFSIKLTTTLINDDEIQKEFNEWVHAFLPNRIQNGRLSNIEATLAYYILHNQLSSNPDPSIALFLHYKNIFQSDENDLKKYIKEFSKVFKTSYKSENLTALDKAMYIFVFDKIESNIAVIPANQWNTKDIALYLSNLEGGLKKWTWEDRAKTKCSNPVKWAVENEYHVQNLLYILLAPIFPDIQDEIYTEPIGQKTPRIDLRIPSANTIIEVKYRKDTKKSFQSLIGELGEDKSLYSSDERFKDSKLICFLWDNTISTQEHSKFKEGILKIGFEECIVINAPSVMFQSSD